LFAQTQTLSCFLPLSPRVNGVGAYTCCVPGTRATAEPPPAAVSLPQDTFQEWLQEKPALCLRRQHSISAAVRARSRISPTPALRLRKGKHHKGTTRSLLEMSFSSPNWNVPKLLLLCLFLFFWQPLGKAPHTFLQTLFMDSEHRERVFTNSLYNVSWALPSGT